MNLTKFSSNKIYWFIASFSVTSLIEFLFVSNILMDLWNLPKATVYCVRAFQVDL